jgi:hypothetical protein
MNVDEKEEDMPEPWFVTELQILAYSGSGGGSTGLRRGRISWRSLWTHGPAPSWEFPATAMGGSWHTPFVKESNESTLSNIVRHPLAFPTAEQHRAFVRNQATLSNIHYSIPRATSWSLSTSAPMM